MDKQEVYDFLNDNGISFEITEHPAVYNMAELADIELPYPEADAKNLFVRDDKHRAFYLITVKGDKRVDLKQFRRDYGTRALSFASDEELMELMGLIPGVVTPLGLLNDTDKRVQFYLDEELTGDGALIGVHPNDNTATIWLKTDDLADILRKSGHEVNIYSSYALHGTALIAAVTYHTGDA